MKLNLDALFGGKPWFKSMVGWSAVMLITAETAVPAAAELGLMDPVLASTISGYLVKVGALFGMLGIRRRLPAWTTVEPRPEGMPVKAKKNK